jgi:hypothetical protein
MPMDQTSNLLEQVYVPGLQTKKSETPRNDKAQGNRRSCSTKSSMIEQNTSKKAIIILGNSKAPMVSKTDS